MKGRYSGCSDHEHKEKNSEVWREAYAAHKQCRAENTGHNKKFFVKPVTQESKNGL